MDSPEDLKELVVTWVCDPDGDAVLVVADSLRIRVSTKVLSVQSPVFRAMFSRSYSEGQQLSSLAPPDIALPEDNPRALGRLCRLMHWDIPALNLDQSIWCSEILHLSITAEKYECTDLLEVWLAEWLPNQLELRLYTTEELFDLLVATYVLREERYFRTISSKLASGLIQRSTLVRLSRSPVASYIPSTVYFQLADLKSEYHDIVFQVIGRPALDIITETSHATGRSGNDRHLQDRNKIITGTRTIMDGVASFSSPAAQVMSTIERLVDPGEGEISSEMRGLFKLLRGAMAECKQKIESLGLCLRCTVDQIDRDGDPFSPHEHEEVVSSNDGEPKNKKRKTRK